SDRPTSSAWSHPDAWVATEVELGGDVRGQAFASLLPLRAAVKEVHRLQQLQHRHLVRALGLGCYMHSTWSEVKSSVFLVEDYAGPLTLARLMKLNQANGWDPQYAYTYADALR
ncbi:dual specificity kinase shkE, partial [Haematococcus lacustris]